ncbi:NlpC/p60-like transpeptidase [Aspergillus lucknowensis]|uniref:NlpC/p60-like transpeptidase n=1 Tax=Aspergillus lucknowensis TaxID=176173 RepID=A0ABR4LJM5_9EURO
MYAYTGSGPYCYAYSLYMVLLASGYERQSLPSAGFIECLTTMPFGKQFVLLQTGPAAFFNNPYTNPDDGINIALRTMGWECEDHRGGDVSSALGKLREAVAHGPVLAGPLDMGHLSYNPEHNSLKGADHFVVVLEVDDSNGMILLHDPAGYPAVLLPLTQFVEAWHGQGVEYIDRPFVFRSHFHRIENVPRAEMVARTIRTLREQAGNYAHRPDSFGGAHALRLTIEAVEAGSPSVVNDLAPFTLPLAARRYLDARDFLNEAGLAEAAEVMEQQAILAGRAQYPAVHRRWNDVIAILRKLVELEDELTEALKAGLPE